MDGPKEGGDGRRERPGDEGGGDGGAGVIGSLEGGGSHITAEQH